MDHKIYYDDDHQTLVQTINGEFTTEETRHFGRLYNQYLEGKTIRHLIVDMREAGKMENRETRSITNEMLNNAQLTSVAFVGATAPVRMVAKVLMKLGSLQAESTFVKDMNEAIAWLENRRS